MKKEKFHSSLFPADIDIDLGDGGDTDTRPKPKRSIGSILVDAGVLSAEDAMRVMEYQNEEGLRFGEAAIRLGLISKGDIQYALSYQYEYEYLPKSAGKNLHPDLVAGYKPFSHEVDQLRAIRSQLKLRWFEETDGNGMLSVVAASRGDGTSYLVANLAVVFAQMGEKTLLIDTNMRAPKQHAIFKINNQLGFSSLLAGRSDVASAIHKVDFNRNLEVIPAGPVPPNPLELLNRDNLTELFEWARENYDIVLIDTPSMTGGADAMMVASKAGAALVIARANETMVSDFNTMIEEMKRSKVNIVGSVLNNPPLINVAG